MTQKVRAVGVRNGRAVWFGEGRVLASALEWLGGYGALARPRGLCLGDVLGKVSKHILASGRCGWWHSLIHSFTHLFIQSVDLYQVPIIATHLSKLGTQQ